jgi:hypothetical protein
MLVSTMIVSTMMSTNMLPVGLYDVHDEILFLVVCLLVAISTMT